MASKQIKLDSESEDKLVLGPEFDDIIENLRSKEKYQKNRYLDTIKSQSLNAKRILDKKIIDAEYEIKKYKIVLDDLKEKRSLFDFYDDGIDPY